MTVRTEIFERVRELFVAQVKRELPINVDGALGCALRERGFSPVAMPGIGAMRFLPSIAHAVEEVSGPLRLRIADGDSVGPPTRHVRRT